MQDDARSDDEIQLSAKLLFEGVVPERSADLNSLWKQYQPKFHLLTDAGPDGLFVMGAGRFRDVAFNHRALRAFWLASFIAWEGYLRVHEQVTKGSANFDRFDAMLLIFSRIITDRDPLSVALPAGVSEPGHYPDPQEYPQERAASELATFGAGWAFLHEIRHLQHQQEDTSAKDGDPPHMGHAEELSCDEFATRFILEGVDIYAHSRNVDREIVRLKRELGIYFVLFSMTLITTGDWSDSDTHPAMQKRIDATIRLMDGSGTRISDAIAHAAFAALWRKRPDAPGPFRVVS